MSGIVGGVGSKSGVIKRPASFLARGEEGWVSISVGAVCPFDDVSTGACNDVYGDFDTSAKKYTAPYTGNYFFWFNIYTANADTSNSFGLMKNGTSIDFTDSSVDELTYDVDSAVDTIVHGYANVALVGGDYIQVEAAYASDFHGSYSTFGGYYIIGG